MIIPDTPRLVQIVRDVSRPLAALFVWDVIVTVFYKLSPFQAPPLPLTLFGSALALFLSLRVNAAYQRWWEGRTLWGLMINASRNYARAIVAFLDDGDPEQAATKRDLVLRQVGYVHALRRRLRQQDPRPDLDALLPPEMVAEALRRANPPNALLDGNGRRHAAAVRRGWIDTIQQAVLEEVMIAIANAQGGMERLKNTPLPSQYRFFPSLFTRGFCLALPLGLVETLGWLTPLGSTVAGIMFLALLEVGDELVDPFAATPHDVPMTSMCNTIEIDLKEAIGEMPPQPVKPVKGVLW